LAGRLGAQLIAIVAEGQHKQVYLSPTPEHEAIAAYVQPQWTPEQALANDPRNIWCVGYGLDTFTKLFTSRQIFALTTFSDLVRKAREQVQLDAASASFIGDNVALAAGGKGAVAYADAITTYLAFAVDRSANYWSSLTPWGGGFIVQTFGRQAIPMVWDYAEGNPLSNSTGNWLGAIDWIARCLITAVPAGRQGFTKQLDATVLNTTTHFLVCTDPPYYDNVDYADLSDYFYVWARHSLNGIYPDLFSTVLTPKRQELIAAPYRFGGSKDKARQFFEDGLGKAFGQLRVAERADYPLALFYAFKQAESRKDSSNVAVVASTGWETMLKGLFQAGFSITGTWPMRTERDQGLKTGTNVLASSIVLVCRPRPDNAPITNRRDFLRALARELPDELRVLTSGRVVPVDLVQAAIGPGMAIFTRYSKVMEADGEAMSVRTALGLINEQIEEFFTQEEGAFDPDTSFCLTWYRGRFLTHRRPSQQWARTRAGERIRSGRPASWATSATTMTAV